jgi:hypothetical protein
MAQKQKTLPLMPPTEELLELIEAHRNLVAMYGCDPAREEDSYSLAQPSPFRFVPTIASNQTAPLLQGE